MSERAITGKEWIAADLLNEYGIPPNLHGGLERYLKQGIRPGSLLESILKNDLAGAMLRVNLSGAAADVMNVVKFLAYEASGAAWGTPGKVEAWIVAKGGGR